MTIKVGCIVEGHGEVEAVPAPDDPEAIRDAKGWLSERMENNRTYRETRDQPALTALFDLERARHVDSFDKCYREIVRLLGELQKVSDSSNEQA